MAKLTNEQQVFIVTQFACYSKLSQVQEAVEERFGIKPSKTLLNGYDMDGWARENHGKKWIPVFDRAREQFHETAATIPIATKAFRLKQLGAMFDTALSAKNLHMAASLLEQAAKESGGSFTNERKVRHDGKVTIKEEVTPEDRRVMLEQHMAAAFEALTSETAH